MCRSKVRAAIAATLLCAMVRGEDAPPAQTTKTGGWRLAKEQSLYLREHADNPVQWYPWGEEAFAEARRLDRPIFLSIGYSACHWCHVMRRESFADDKVAEALARTCVAIKVDREELPHVDDAYMDWVQQNVGRGGWPLSVFLTPERKPFYGGTYYPKDVFLRLLDTLAESWHTQREKLLEISTKTVEALAAGDRRRGDALAWRALLERGITKIAEQYDSTHGGFGVPPHFTPKFPSPRTIIFLTALASLEERPELREMALHTLRRMARGGMFDQVGGGFHRYAVDAAWTIPHFEKMLYNQGMLAETYLEAYRMTGDEEMRYVAKRTLDAMLRDFALESGGFAASWDADSEEREGFYYGWNPAQVEAAVGSDAAPLICALLGVTEAGNFEGGLTIPVLLGEPAALAEKFGLAQEKVSQRLRDGLGKLLSARGQRIPPKRDDKVILGWNATAVSALARGGILLKEIRYLKAAESAHAYADKHLAQPTGFLRRIAGGSANHRAALQDAALHLKACLDLYHATLRPQHVARAIELVDEIEREFGAGVDGGGLYEMAEGAQVLVPRRKLFVDDALTSGNGTLAACLLRLHGLTGEGRYRERATRIIEEAATVISDYPHAAPELLLAALMAAMPMPEVAIVGELSDPATQALLDVVIRSQHPFLVHAHRPGGEAGDRAAHTVPLLRDRLAVGGKATAYLCVNFSCLAPQTDPTKLKSALAECAKPLRGAEPADAPQEKK